jgi:16S rRNA (guanine1207-N2)-methyltransferase
MKGRFHDEPEFFTEQLPIGPRVSLYSGVVSPKVIKKFKKEEPEAYLAVSALLKDSDFRNVRNIFVRENGYGHIPVMLAAADNEKLITVSLWSLDTLETLNRNITVNLLESRIRTIVQGTVPRYKYDSAILIHERYQSHSTVIKEASDLLNIATSDVFYIISHKNKGIETVVERMVTELPINVEIISKGLGGVRVLKIRSLTDQKTVERSIFKTITYFVGNVLSITFKTGLSLFSPEQVDAGSDLLIRYVLDKVHKKSKVRIYDMACGYGAIGLSLAKALPNSFVVLSDSNARAVDITNMNARNEGLSERSTVILSDGPDQISGEFDLVVTNPPLHIERRKLIGILSRSRKLVKRGGRLILVVEDSRVPEIKELLAPTVGYLKEVRKSSSHVVLENKK